MSGVFTGIIQHVGRVVAIRATEAGKRLRIDVGPLARGLSLGASMAVDGACLTASAIDGSVADFDAVPETISRTTLGRLAAGARVNLEPALALGGALDGHLVQGHVDAVAEVARVERGRGGHVIHLSADAAVTGQMVPKGSVALAGVSLTLVTVERSYFSVAIVPATLERTTLADVRISDPLNVELDIMGKYVRRYLQQIAGPGPLTLERLREEGFA